MTESLSNPQPSPGPDGGSLAGVRRTGANATWLALERMAHLGVAFLVTVVVARELGPVDLGRLAVGLSLLSLLLPIVGIAVNCLVRDAVGEPQAANQLYAASILATGAVTAAIVVVVTVVVAFTVGIGSSSGTVIVVVVGSALLRPFGVADAWFQIRLANRTAALIKLAALLVTGAVRIALPIAGIGVVWIAWTYVAEAALASLGVWLAYRRRETGYQWVVDGHRLWSLLKELGPLLFAASSALIFRRLDQVMLAWLSDLTETGLFAVASSLADAPVFPLLAIFMAVAPRLLTLKNTDPERYLIELRQVARLLVLLGYLLTLGLIFVVAPLAPILLGAEYAQTQLLIIILACTTPFVCVGGVLLFVTNWDKLYREAVVRNLVAAAISIGLNFVLLPRYGALGAAITTVVATVWVFFIGAALARRTRPCFWLTLPAFEPVGTVRMLLRMRREGRGGAGSLRGRAQRPDSDVGRQEDP